VSGVGLRWIKLSGTNVSGLNEENSGENRLSYKFRVDVSMTGSRRLGRGERGNTVDYLGWKLNDEA